MVTAWSDVPPFTLTVPKLRLGGSAEMPVAPVAPALALGDDPRLSVGDGLPVPVVPPPVVEVVPSVPVELLTPGGGFCDAVFVFVCLPPTPSSRGISTPRPVTMAATPEMTPGTVVQKLLFPSGMRHLLSHLISSVLYSGSLGAGSGPSGRAVCSQRPGRVKANPGYLPKPRRSTQPGDRSGGEVEEGGLVRTQAHPQATPGLDRADHLARKPPCVERLPALA